MSCFTRKVSSSIFTRKALYLNNALMFRSNGSSGGFAVRIVKRTMIRKESSLKRKVSKSQRKEKRATKTLGIVVGMPSLITSIPLERFATIDVELRFCFFRKLLWKLWQSFMFCGYFVENYWITSVTIGNDLLVSIAQSFENIHLLVNRFNTVLFKGFILRRSQQFIS